MADAKHTPGHLVVGRHGAIEHEQSFDFTRGQGRKQLFLACVVPEGLEGEQIANAHRLALCWNSHDELLTALRRLLSIAREEFVDPIPEFEEAEEAIAKATGSAS